MPMTKAEINALFAMTPAGALRYLENKGLRIRTDAENMTAVDHAHSFGFANLARLDIAQDLVNGLREGLAKGQTPQWFVDNLTPILRKKGWWGTQEHINTETGEITKKQLGNPARLGTLFRTATQSAMMAGRYESMTANAEARPYWRYMAVMDLATRPSHAKLHGKVFHHTDPIWRFIFPPNGFNCRCRVEALRLSEVNEMGLVISQTDAVISQDVTIGKDDNDDPIMTSVNGVRFMDSGEEVTFYPDVGFDVNPGLEVFKANMDNYDIELARPYVAAGLNGPELGQMLKTAQQSERTGDLLAAAILTPKDMAEFAVKSRTVWLAEHRLAQQVNAKTLPDVADWLKVQTTIESATVVIRVKRTLLLYSRKSAGEWYQAALDNGLNILSFTVVDDSILAVTLNQGKVLRDLR